MGATLPRAAGDGIERFEFGGRLDVEAADARRQRSLHLGRRFADAGKHYPRGIAAGGDDSRELAAGDDVEAAAQAGQDVQYSEVGIRLDRVADQMRHARECRVEDAEPGLERRARIDVARGAEALGDLRERYAFGVEFAAHDGKRVHGLRSGDFGAGASDGAAVGVGGSSDDGAPVAGEGGVGSFRGPFTPQAGSGATPIDVATAQAMARGRMRTLKSRNIGAES